MSLFHLSIFQIQSLLESRNQTGHKYIFDQAHSQKIQSFFNLHEFILACKKSVNSICSFLRHSQF